MDASFETLTTFTDEQLCTLAAEGSGEAEEILVLRYSRLVRALSHSLYLSGGDSDDLSQEGMIGLLRAIRSYRGDKEALFSTYAELCVRRRMYSALRAANSGKQATLNNSVSIDTSLFDGNSFPADAGNVVSFANPEDLLIARERMDAFFPTIKKRLSDFEAKVLRFYLDGYSCREIAKLTHREYKSVDNAVQRLRRKIAQHLSGETSIS